MSRFAAVPTAALDDDRLEALHIRVLTALCSYADKDGWCRVGQDLIAGRARTNPARVSQCISDLVAWGWMRRQRVGKMKANVYQVLMDCEMDVSIPLPTEQEHLANTANHVTCPPSKSPLPVEQITLAETANPIGTPFFNTVLNTETVSASAPARPPKAESVDYVRADRAFQLFVQAATRQRCWSVPEAMNKTRRASLTARVREVGLEGWERAIHRAERSPFLTGRTGDKPFGLTLDWMLKPANFTKIIEGNYDDRTHHARNGSASGHAGSNGSRPDAFDRLAERLQGGPSGPDAWQHDDPGTADGYVIDAGPARLAG